MKTLASAAAERIVDELDDATREAIIAMARKQSKAKRVYTPDQLLELANAINPTRRFEIVAAMGHLPSKRFYSGKPKWVSIWSNGNRDDAADWVPQRHFELFYLARAVKAEIDLESTGN